MITTVHLLHAEQSVAVQIRKGIGLPADRTKSMAARCLAAQLARLYRFEPHAAGVRAASLRPKSAILLLLQRLTLNSSSDVTQLQVE